jgi:hypothetical protein
MVPIGMFNRPSGILQAEAFKIDAGLIAQAEAVGTSVPYHSNPRRSRCPALPLLRGAECVKIEAPGAAHAAPRASRGEPYAGRARPASRPSVRVGLVQPRVGP